MKKLSAVAASLCLLCVLTAALPVASATAPPPSGLTVLVIFPPGDLALSLRYFNGDADQIAPLRRTQQAWEAQFNLFYTALFREAEGAKLDDAALVVQTGGETFECPLPDKAQSRYGYSYVTLNLKQRAVMMGEPAGLQVLYTVLWIMVTILTKGLVFFVFGYRQKRSWAVFLLVNLVAQPCWRLLQSILLNSPGPMYYWPIIYYAVSVLLLFTAEIVALAVLLTERRRARAVVFSLAANAAAVSLSAIMRIYLPI